jgi:hypothetical protein
MLRSFRRKIAFVVKYFRRNHFKNNNNFLENICRCLVHMKKLQKVKMQLSPESDDVRSPLPDSGEHVWPDLAKIAGFRPDSSEFGQIRSNLCHFGQIWPTSDHGQFRPEFGPPASGDGGRMSPNSGASNISEARCCRISVPPGFRQSDIKYACKDEEFNFGK